MRVLVCAVLIAAATSGCSGETEDGAVASSGVTATATVTATARVTATVVAASLAPLTPVEGFAPLAVPGKPRRISLRVFGDGCGVVRGPASPTELSTLTWVLRDADGFQVLGRNARNERRYRYFGSGTFTVDLEAWQGDRYAPVSRTVTVHC